MAQAAIGRRVLGEIEETSLDEVCQFPVLLAVSCVLLCRTSVLGLILQFSLQASTLLLSPRFKLQPRTLSPISIGRPHHLTMLSYHFQLQQTHAPDFPISSGFLILK